MKNFLIAVALLTTLFVSGTPLHAASDTNGVPSAGDCTTFEMLVSPDNQADFEKGGGKIVKLTKDQTAALVAEAEKRYGSAHPEIDTAILLLKSNGNGLVIWFAKGGCFLGTDHVSDEQLQMIYDAIEGKKS